MDTLRVVAAWIMFLLMAIAAAAFWRQSTLRGERMEALEATLAGMQEGIASLAEEVDALQTRLAAVAVENDEGVPSGLEGSEGPSGGAGGANAPALSFFENLLTALRHDSDEAAVPADLFQQLTGLFQGEAGQEFLNEAFRGSMELRYGPFLDTLPPETAQAFMDVLLDRSMQAAQLGMQLLRPDSQDEDTAARMESFIGEMDEQLRMILGEDGYEAYLEHSSQATAIAFEEQVDMQLRMFGGNLNPEVRELISATLAEEMMADLEQNQLPSMNAAIDAHAAALDRAMERLHPQLDEEAYRALERIADHQRRMHDMMNFLMPRPREQ